jgi:hypothetical protein
MQARDTLHCSAADDVYRASVQRLFWPAGEQSLTDVKRAKTGSTQKITLISRRESARENFRHLSRSRVKWMSVWVKRTRQNKSVSPVLIPSETAKALRYLVPNAGWSVAL